MPTFRSITRIQALEMQLEEAIQMLRLVADNKRTCVEIAEWLDITYPENKDELSNTIVETLLKKNKRT
jgi:hypothetical protein